MFCLPVMLWLSVGLQNWLFPTGPETIDVGAFLLLGHFYSFVGEGVCLDTHTHTYPRLVFNS